jgi:hypothetical protein
MMDGSSYSWYERRCIDFLDDNGNVKFYLCQMYKNGKPYGPSFEARTIDEVNAWWRLHLGAYDTIPNHDDDGGQDEGAAA